MFNPNVSCTIGLSPTAYGTTVIHEQNMKYKVTSEISKANMNAVSIVSLSRLHACYVT